MSCQVARLMLLCLTALLLIAPAAAQIPFSLAAAVSGNQVTLRWNYPQPDPWAFLCWYQIDGGAPLTCGVLNGDSRENTDYQPNGSYVFWLEAQAEDGSTLATSTTVAVTVAALDPTATATPSATAPAPPATMPALTPIPTVVLQLGAIISTTGQVAQAQRDAWSPSADTAPLLLGLASVVVILCLLRFLIGWVRP